MSTQIDTKLDPSTPTPISAFGPKEVAITGAWNGGQVIFERKLPGHAGDPPGGNWNSGVPWSDAVDAPRQPAQPYIEHDGPRIYWFSSPPFRARVIPGRGQRAPSLVMSIGDVEG